MPLDMDGRDNPGHDVSKQLADRLDRPLLLPI
jgi:hypothetical protein